MAEIDQAQMLRDVIGLVADDIDSLISNAELPPQYEDDGPLRAAFIDMLEAFQGNLRAQIKEI